MLKEWRIKENSSTEKSLVKRLLISRGIKSEQEIYDFLHPLETKVSQPEVFSDMEKTVQRLACAIDNGDIIKQGLICFIIPPVFSKSFLTGMCPLFLVNSPASIFA